jgi:hypothetical protein
VAKSNTRIFILGLSVLIVLVLLAIFSVGVPRLSSRALAQRNQSNVSLPQQPDKPQRGTLQEIARKRQELEARVPTADYDSPEPTSPEEKAKRRKRNRHYDGKGLVTSNPYSSTTAVTVDDEVFYDLPALPVAQSDVILTADVLNSEAHLSNDKSGVYSEFNVQVDSVLKGAVPALSQTNVIGVSRLGGIVRYPSGHTERYEIAHQNMPAVGKRYLFFLKATEDAQAYEIVTGYEIGPERVQPLDWGGKVEAFRDTDSAVFLKTVRDAIASKN